MKLGRKIKSEPKEDVGPNRSCTDQVHRPTLVGVLSVANQKLDHNFQKRQRPVAPTHPGRCTFCPQQTRRHTEESQVQKLPRSVTPTHPDRCAFCKNAQEAQRPTATTKYARCEDSTTEPEATTTKHIDHTRSVCMLRHSQKTQQKLHRPVTSIQPGRCELSTRSPEAAPTGHTDRWLSEVLSSRHTDRSHRPTPTGVAAPHQLPLSRSSGFWDTFVLFMISFSCFLTLWVNRTRHACLKGGRDTL